MRYFKGTKDTSRDVLKTVIEMINIEYNKEYFDSTGEILDEPRANAYNKYKLHGITYEIHHDKYVLYIFSGNAKLIQSIQDKYYEMIAMVESKYNLPTYNDKKTTHNVIEKYPCGRRVAFLINKPFTNDQIAGKTWHIYDGIYKYYYISNYTKPTNNNCVIINTNSIILDYDNVLSLKDGYRSLDMPSIDMHTRYIDGYIIDYPVFIHLLSGIDGTISRYYKPGNQYISINYYDDAIYWIKWEDINAIDENDGDDDEGSTDSLDVDLTKLNINNNADDTDDSMSSADSTIADPDYKPNQDELAENNEDDNRDELVEAIDKLRSLISHRLDKKFDITHAVNKAAPKCFISGIPIYEDCYLFDIYSFEGVKCDKPFQILISPIVFHSIPGTAVKLILDNIDCKLIVYRSFCPISAKQIINNTDMPQHVKTMLEQFDKTATYTPTSITSNHTNKRIQYVSFHHHRPDDENIKTQLFKKAEDIKHIYIYRAGRD